MGKLATGAHENIIKILDYGELRNSTYSFIDMELCDFDLKEYIESRHQYSSYTRVPEKLRGQGGMPSFEMWNIMSQIANGVAFIHSHREVHRDLKPRNGMCLTKPHSFRSTVFADRSTLEGRRLWPYH
jgi:serine/threonine protein kinase